ncbi:acyl-CoA dehydrogenase family protein [Micromonospora peucetia]|uniref:acyl-CoA dehydrogenase family protein n=1 Tax=Micromonospora peucetia TaxID=47871 RepID=UPI0022583115|nr:acyl-CoA dehydrogenase family protein [Micromonospora peucetia]MCX4385674.1 acyl-CoA dehydrogenase family protein [Micromonospora peucetia]
MTGPERVDPALVDMLDSVFAAHRPARTEVAATLDVELWKLLESLGLTRLTGAEPYGAGAGWPEAAALLAAAARHAVPLPLAEHDLLAGWLLERAGLPADGALRTACVLDADGRARAVPWARAAARIVLLFPAADGWRVADVPAAAVAVTEADNVAGEPRDAVAVDLAGLDGTPVDADLAERLLLRGALARTVQMCGAMDRVLELCVAHTTARTQFGRPLAAFQAVQGLVADIAAESSLARVATDAAVLRAAEGDDDGLAFAVAVARSCAGHAASVVVRNAHQVHGAIGTTLEHELHGLTRPVLAWRSEFGSLQHWDELLTRAALDAGGDGVWALISQGALPTPRR